MLTAGEIAGMRETVGETLVDTAVIQGGTVVGDSGGGGTTAWVASGTISCHLSPLVVQSGDEEVYAERITSGAAWVITIPAETAVEHDDRLVIDGTSYEVVSLRAPRTWELSRRIIAKEVQ